MYTMSMTDISTLEEKVKELEKRLGKLENKFKTQVIDWPSTPDELLEEAKKIVIEFENASASFLQRKLSIGYARAARLIDELHQIGVVGPAIGANPRKVLIKPVTPTK